MAKFFSRLFGRSGSSSKRSPFHASQPSINDTSGRTGASAGMRPAASLDNLSSYQINLKQLEKNKLHKASWDGNLQKVERLAGPGQINMKDQQFRVIEYLFSSSFKFILFCFV
jgi:hypothetical protein